MSFLTNVSSGASTGAAVGTVVPGVGTFIGGVVGAVIGSVVSIKGKTEHFTDVEGTKIGVAIAEKLVKPFQDKFGVNVCNSEFTKAAGLSEIQVMQTADLWSNYKEFYISVISARLFQNNFSDILAQFFIYAARNVDASSTTELQNFVTAYFPIILNGMVNELSPSYRQAFQEFVFGVPLNTDASGTYTPKEQNNYLSQVTGEGLNNVFGGGSSPKATQTAGTATNTQSAGMFDSYIGVFIAVGVLFGIIFYVTHTGKSR